MRLLFLVYVGAMIWLLFGQRLGSGNYDRSINLTPFATLRLYEKLLRSSNSPYLIRHAFINLVGNVVMFIPLGYYLPYFRKKLRGFFKTFFAAALLVLAIEVIQYVTCLGSCDIDDLILNMAGVAMGYILWRITRR